MIGYLLPLCCPLCGEGCEHVASSTACGSEARAVCRCTGCGREFLIDVHMRAAPTPAAMRARSSRDRRKAVLACP